MKKEKYVNFDDISDVTLVASDCRSLQAHTVTDTLCFTFVCNMCAKQFYYFEDT